MTGTWEDEAANWVRWARTPGHDVFPRFWPVFAADILPAAAGRVLEVGCGEGRVARAMTALGHRVTGLDASPTLVRDAHDAPVPDGGPPATFVAGDGTRLPFADAAFDSVVAYNSLQAMRAFDDMAHAVAESARVVRAGGRVCLCVAHPMTDVGRVRPGSGAEIVITGAYFRRDEVNETVTKDGLEMTFHGWTYTLEDYARALESAGCAIERVREPPPASADGNPMWTRLPLFLMLRAVRLT